MKRLLIILIIISTILSGCIFGDDQYEFKKLTKDFWLNWTVEENNKTLLLSTEKDGNGGTILIKETVFAVGYDDNFIIAKQHPNRQEEIQKRLFNYDTTEKAYLLTDPSDTIYISGKDDSIFKKNGNYYHISNGWNPPDSLKPYKNETNYFIIDIRKYKRQQPNNYDTYKFQNENDFLKKRQQLKISDQLTFSIIDSSLM